MKEENNQIGNSEAIQRPERALRHFCPLGWKDSKMKFISRIERAFNKNPFSKS